MWRAYPLAVGAALSCLGYGFTLARLLGIAVTLGDAGILGLVCLALLGCAIHFVSALSPAVQFAVLGAGLAICALFRNELVRQSRGNLAAILVGLSAFFHRFAITFYDTGLYHLQAVQWNSRFPVTLGLGNLHGRLAFNSLLYTMAPLDDLAGIGWISGLLLLLFVLLSCYTRFSQARRDSVEYWFLAAATCLLALGAPGLLEWLGVLNADGFVAILTVYWFSVALSLPGQARTSVALLLLSAALALTVKLSAAPLLALALAAAWLHRRGEGPSPLRPLAAAAVLLGLWMARGIALSGCAAYPLAQSCLDLPWAVSRSQAALELVGTKAWARAAGRLDYLNVMADWTWLGPWAVHTLRNWSCRLFLFGGLAGVAALLAGARTSRRAMAFLAGLGLCLAYWFWSAPDARFGSGYLAVAGLLGLSLACTVLFPPSDLLRRLVPEALVLSALLGAASLAHFGNTWAIESRPAFEMRAAPGGKPISVTGADTQGSDQCWDRPVPCTPYFDSEKLKRVRWR